MKRLKCNLSFKVLAFKNLEKLEIVSFLAASCGSVRDWLQNHPNASLFLASVALRFCRFSHRGTGSSLIWLAVASRQLRKWRWAVLGLGLQRPVHISSLLETCHYCLNKLSLLWKKYFFLFFNVNLLWRQTPLSLLIGDHADVSWARPGVPAEVQPRPSKRSSTVVTAGACMSPSRPEETFNSPTDARPKWMCVAASH